MRRSCQLIGKGGNDSVLDDHPSGKSVVTRRVGMNSRPFSSDPPSVPGHRIPAGTCSIPSLQSNVLPSSDTNRSLLFLFLRIHFISFFFFFSIFSFFFSILLDIQFNSFFNCLHFVIFNFFLIFEINDNCNFEILNTAQRTTIILLNYYLTILLRYY